MAVAHSLKNTATKHTNEHSEEWKNIALVKTNEWMSAFRVQWILFSFALPIYKPRNLGSEQEEVREKLLGQMARVLRMCQSCG